ncbi:peptidoglycan-recognition protein LF-like [Drosophila rhopaloa]|uniref:Peptidoglycan-recognition protein LF-like n=1 Tax=Drosophila rhopaloa TaxID=1041015 RepID=A0A6P4E0Y9_DRORH|nr:peptidoglycan-recognition protein LF-like [Drosophila rhopaloa]
MPNLELNGRGENGKKGVKIRRLYFAAFLLFFITIPLGYYIWMRSHKNDLPMIHRDEWGAREPLTKDYLNLPVQNVVIYHTATEQCQTKDICINSIHNLQDLHMEFMNWQDIGHNFLVGGDGEVYEGRGWDVRGHPLRGYESVSISIGFIGTFSNVEPPVQQVEAAKRLMHDGVRREKLHPNYMIYGQRQFEPTESPGQKLYELMKQWPRWSTIIRHLD